MTTPPQILVHQTNVELVLNVLTGDDTKPQRMSNTQGLVERTASTSDVTTNPSTIPKRVVDMGLHGGKDLDGSTRVEETQNVHKVLTGSSGRIHIGVHTQMLNQTQGEQPLVTLPTRLSANLNGVIGTGGGSITTRVVVVAVCILILVVVGKLTGWMIIQRIKTHNRRLWLCSTLCSRSQFR